MLAEFEVDCIFHLAALLSTRAEFTPLAAHQVNVEGTLNLLEFAQHEGESHGRPVIFVYPSSIAAYGLPDRETKMRAGRVVEDAFVHPTTMYGCNKLYCEELGRYYTTTLQAAVGWRRAARGLPGRAVSWVDLGHDAAGGRHVGLRFGDDPRRREGRAVRVLRDGPIRPSRSWRCPDAADTLLTLADTRRDRLTRTTYNVCAFSRSAAAIRKVVAAAFPGAAITYKIDEKRQGIVDSWPADVDDSRARADWGFRPAYDFDRAFREYLIPTIRSYYAHDRCHGVRARDRLERRVRLRRLRLRARTPGRRSDGGTGALGRPNRRHQRRRWPAAARRRAQHGGHRRAGPLDDARRAAGRDAHDPQGAAALERARRQRRERGRGGRRGGRAARCRMRRSRP